MKRPHIALWLALPAVLLIGCRRSAAPPSPPPTPLSSRPPSVGGKSAVTTTNDNLALGNPSGARPDEGAADNYLIERPQYALAYDAAMGHADWVSWRLSAKDIGKTERSKFAPDPALPQDFYRVTPRDYTNTGYDRGHLCPSADRSRRAADNRATFFMTNIVPQAPGSNQGPWKDLEEYCRGLAEQGNELYIVAGGTGKEGSIAGGKVAVPQATWKAVVVLPESAGDDASRVNRNTRVIAVWMPNEDTIRDTSWTKYRVSVDEIERRTRLDLFSSVPKSVQDAVEKRVDRE